MYKHEPPPKSPVKDDPRVVKIKRPELLWG